MPFGGPPDICPLARPPESRERSQVGTSLTLKNLTHTYQKYSPQWAESNAVRFKTTNTEAILLSRKRKRRQGDRAVRVGDQQVRFAREATRWLGI